MSKREDTLKLRKQMNASVNIINNTIYKCEIVTQVWYCTDKYFIKIVIKCGLLMNPKTAMQKNMELYPPSQPDYRYVCNNALSDKNGFVH